MSFTKKFPQRWLPLAAAFLFLLAAEARGGDTTMTARQVKALCLLNFAKYVEWRGGDFANSNSPICVMVAGDAELAGDMEKAATNKTVSGRALSVRALKEGEPADCQVLFIAAKENRKAASLLAEVKGRPTLTVGEGDSFLDAGGMIAFVVRNGRVRFDIDLKQAGAARVRISSMVLSLADSVRGRTP